MQPMGVQYGWHDPVKTNRSNPHQRHEATPVHKESTNVKIRGCMHAVMQSQAHLGVRQRPGDSQVLKQRYLHFQQVHGRSPRSLLVQSLDGLQTSDTGQRIPRWQ